MRILIISLFLAVSFSLSAQKINVGIDLSSGVTMAKVKDQDARASGNYFIADGLTNKEGNKGYSGIKLSIEKGLTDKTFFKTGIWFSQKDFFIRNTDGGYSGVSQYNVSYLQIPILLKYEVKEVYENVMLSFDVGPVIEIKSSEKLKDMDGAHFWNMSRNYTVVDGWRGINGNNKEMPLFGGFDFGMYLNIVGNYKLQDNITLCGGFSYLQSTCNIFNKKILFKAPYESSHLTDLLSLKSSVLAIELGVMYTLPSK